MELKERRNLGVILIIVPIVVWNVFMFANMPLAFNHNWTGSQFNDLVWGCFGMIMMLIGLVIILLNQEYDSSVILHN